MQLRRRPFERCGQIPDQPPAARPAGKARVTRHRLLCTEDPLCAGLNLHDLGRLQSVRGGTPPSKPHLFDHTMVIVFERGG